MNRKFIISFLQAVIVLPILSIVICMLGIPIGIIVAFFKNGVFHLSHYVWCPYMSLLFMRLR
ncbi:hypothetical protein BvCmsNSP039_04612 [Escherichia coli]|nr:hypothetical protein BvCmsNSP039_04612 [Escherichia coli]